MMTMLLPFWFGLLGTFGAVPVADDPVAVRQHYEQAASRLDPGGDLYVVKSIDGAIAQTLDRFSGIMPAASAQTAGEPLQSNLMADIQAYLEQYGVLAAHTMAASTVPRDDGLRDVKLFVGREHGVSNAAFWRGLTGGDPVPQQHLPAFPRSTVLAFETAAELDQLWSMVRDGILRFACDGDTQKLRRLLAEAHSDSGVDWDGFLNNLKPNLAVSLQLDPAKSITLPTPGGEAVTIGQPGFLVAVGVRNHKPLRALISLLKRKGADLQPTETDFGTMYQATSPVEGPIPVRFAAIMREETLYFASDPDSLRLQLTADESDRLAAQQDFRETRRDMATTGNAFYYCDSRFRALVNRVAANLQSMQVRHPRQMAAFGMFLPAKQPEVSSGWAVTNLPDGLLLAGTGNGDFARQLTSGNATMPLMMAAVAIPSFIRARGTAQRNVCINNLRQLDGAKAQWALETNAATGKTPTPAQVGVYLRGGFEALKCPQDGTYSINPVGQDPTCTVPGHQLP